MKMTIPSTTKFRLLLLASIFLIVSAFFLVPSIPILTPAPQHPVPLLIRQAELVYSQFEANKSSSLKEAYNRYHAHTGRLPPKGYDDWYQKAIGVKACNVDAFDELHESLRIWWALEPAEIRRRTEKLARVAALGRVCVREGNVLSTTEMLKRHIDPGLLVDSEARRGLEEMVAAVIKLGVKLPDVDFFVNHLDEPRIVIPYELRSSLEDLAQHGLVRRPVEEVAVFHDLNVRPHDHAFAIMRRSCPSDSLARTARISKFPGSSPKVTQTYTSSFTTPVGHFLSSPRHERAWCNQPDIQDLHATFIRPLSFSWSDQLFPVFSNSKIEGFNDILVPPWYVWGGHMPYHSEEDVEWAEKADNLYWRGSNTGGKSFGLNWMGWLRSRFVSLVNRPITWEREDKVVLATASGSQVVATLPSFQLNAAWTDVAFSTTDAHGDPESLKSQRQEPSFRFSGRIPFKKNYGSKAVMDMDGTAYSGRWTTLMRSKSAVFKSRLYVEAMDETLIPWYHYVPVSIRFSEIYSLLGYFFGPGRILDLISAAPESAMLWRKETTKAVRGAAHEHDLKTLAERGTKWAEECARKQDSVTFVHLLILEWGRLTSEDRDSMSFIMPDEDV